MAGQLIPPLIRWEQNCRNGMSPSASFYGQCEGAINFNMSHRTREVFSMSWPLASAHSTSGTTSWRFRFRSRYGATRLRAYVIALQTNRYDATNPRIEIDVDDGSTVETIGPFYTPPVPSTVTPTNGPIEWFATNTYCAINSATTYSCTLKAIDWAKIAAVTVVEEIDATVDPSIPYFSGTCPGVTTVLVDSLRERLLAGSVAMYKQGGGTITHWANPDGSNRTRTSATLINLIDNSTTGSPATSAPGFYLDNSYRNSASRTTVPYEMAVYASIPAGSGTVRLTDSGGTDRISVTVNSATPQWFTATGNLPTAETWYSYRFASDGINQISVGFVSLVEWEA